MAVIPDDLLDRVWNGSIIHEDVQYLLKIPSFRLFSLADELCNDVNGDIVTYVINRNINFTNLCVGTCKFCAFRDDNGYVLSMNEIMNKVEEALDSGATEVCIQGGLLDGIGISYYCDLLENIKSSYDIHIHAFSSMEVFHAAKNSNISIKTALLELKKAGLDSMPGTAAEILVDDVRKVICPSKLSSDQWIDVIKTAHQLGIPTTATMMYGHIETENNRIDHLFKIREIQKETGGFTEFIPLPFLSKNTSLEGYCSTNSDDLKIHALARVVFHTHIKNIQASWVKLGKKFAQLSLFCGVNDLGGTLMEENISKSAGGAYGECMMPEEFESIISNVRRIPKRRTTLYQIH